MNRIGLEGDAAGAGAFGRRSLATTAIDAPMQQLSRGWPYGLNAHGIRLSACDEDRTRQDNANDSRIHRHFSTGSRRASTGGIVQQPPVELSTRIPTNPISWPTIGIAVRSDSARNPPVGSTFVSWYAG